MKESMCKDEIMWEEQSHEDAATLWDEMAEAFEILTPMLRSDGEGGFTLRLDPGIPFRGYAVPERESRVEDDPILSVTGIYRLTMERGVPVMFADYIRRVSDGMMFRSFGVVREAPDWMDLPIATVRVKGILETSLALAEDGDREGFKPVPLAPLTRLCGEKSA